MWALLGGFFVGRGFRNASLPDSVKQQKYDARQARRHPPRTYSEHAIGNKGFWPIVLVLLGACVVAVLAVALFQ